MIEVGASLNELTGAIADAAYELQLINSGEATLKGGLKGVVNGLPPSASPRLRVNQLPGTAAAAGDTP